MPQAGQVFFNSRIMPGLSLDHAAQRHSADEVVALGPVSYESRSFLDVCEAAESRRFVPLRLYPLFCRWVPEGTGISFPVRGLLCQVRPLRMCSTTSMSRQCHRTLHLLICHWRRKPGTQVRYPITEVIRLQSSSKPSWRCCPRQRFVSFPRPPGAVETPPADESETDAGLMCSGATGTPCRGLPRTPATLITRQRAAQREMVVAPYLVTGATDSRHYLELTSRMACSLSSCCPSGLLYSQSRLRSQELTIPALFPAEVFRFVPLMISKKAGDIGRFHSRNERAGVDDYLNAVRFYKHFISLSVGKQ